MFCLERYKFTRRIFSPDQAKAKYHCMLKKTTTKKHFYPPPPTPSHTHIHAHTHTHTLTQMGGYMGFMLFIHLLHFCFWVGTYNKHYLLTFLVEFVQHSVTEKVILNSLFVQIGQNYITSKTSHNRNSASGLNLTRNIQIINPCHAE